MTQTEVKTRTAKVPDLRIPFNHKISQLLDQPVYTLPVIPNRCEVGLIGDPLNDCLQSLGIKFRRFHSNYQQALSVILYSARTLQVSRDQDPEGLYALVLPRRAQGFFPKPRYRVNDIGRVVWCNLIDSLVGCGLLVKELAGYKTSDHMQGVSSIYRPTRGLTEWLDDVFCQLESQPLSDNPELILLSSRNGRCKELVDYHDNEETEALRRQVALINDTFKAARFEEWSATEGQYDEYAPCMKIYKRKFRDTFSCGGRLHCRLQTLPKVSRKGLRINRSPTVELDYGSHQIRILYHLHGLEAPVDCYDHSTISRSIMKGATTRIMNCATERKAKGALAKFLKELKQEERFPDHQQELTPVALFDAVISLHPILRDCMSETLWKKLQFVESSIAMAVMEGLSVDGHPCLGIHDSFVVAETVEDRLRELMVEEYQKRLGFSPIITLA